jgi:hypothetical protein
MGLILSGDLAVLQASMLNSLAFDPFALFEDRPRFVLSRARNVTVYAKRRMLPIPGFGLLQN